MPLEQGNKPPGTWALKLCEACGRSKSAATNLPAASSFENFDKLELIVSNFDGFNAPAKSVIGAPSRQFGTRLRIGQGHHGNAYIFHDDPAQFKKTKMRRDEEGAVALGLRRFQILKSFPLIDEGDRTFQGIGPGIKIIDHYAPELRINLHGVRLSRKSQEALSSAAPLPTFLGFIHAKSLPQSAAPARNHDRGNKTTTRSPKLNQPAWYVVSNRCDAILRHLGFRTGRRLLKAESRSDLAVALEPTHGVE